MKAEGTPQRYPGLAAHYSGKRVFVTGATGFVGAHLARRLLDYGARVTFLSRPVASGVTPRPIVQELIKRGASAAEGALEDRESILRGAENAEFIFHIGAVYREARFADEYYFQVNLEGTRNTLDAAVAAQSAGTLKRYLFCSTTGVHSHIEHPPADESAPFNPGDVYQRSKAEAELLVRRYITERQLPAAVIRPAMIWGEEDLRFLKLFRGISQRRMPLFGDGETWTHWIYVHDLVDAFLLAGREERAIGETFLIAGEQPVRMNEVFRTIAKLADTTPLPRIPHRPVQLLGSVVEALCRPFGVEPPLHRRRVDFFIKNRAFKIDRARELLGYRPEHTFQEEAERIFNWYRGNKLI